MTTSGGQPSVNGTTRLRALSGAGCPGCYEMACRAPDPRAGAPDRPAGRDQPALDQPAATWLSSIVFPSLSRNQAAM